MAAGATASWVLSQEARALLSRLGRVKPFALQETMVPAAGLSLDAHSAVEHYLSKGRDELRGQVLRYLEWLQGPEGRAASPQDAHKRFTFLRLRFNAVLSQFDIFSEAMSQRSEAETGVWLAGLDAVARDALALPGYFDPPPVVTYLARGPGAAIRRARTRLPGGGENPVAIVRIPRERMIGSGIASSLVHEVGHQGAALLDLVASLRESLKQRRAGDGNGRDAVAWRLWSRWISEVVADLWSVAKVGVASTSGLIGVVSLPSAFVFRIDADDPHPAPWIRVKLSAAIGKALYPHPQWERLAQLWGAFYPAERLDERARAVFAALEASIPEFVERLVTHRAASLARRPLGQVLSSSERQPAKLAALYETWRRDTERMRRAAPSLAFAVIGQARADGAISPEKEADVLAELLKYWALRNALDSSSLCVARGRSEKAKAVVAPAEYPAQAVI
jgi:hypothetical protein